MTVTPVVDEGLGNSASVVDLGDGDGMVVDPERDPRPYATSLAAAGLRPRFVIETHLHADFVSGGLELVAQGAELLAPTGSELAAPHRPLADGDEVALGGLTLQVITTPGHTPEHLGYLLKHGSRPVGLVSGGTLMAGEIARTDLLSPELTEPPARQAYRSIHERLFALPDDLPVFPTHGAGPRVPELSPAAFQAVIEADAEVVDARASAAFASGHIPGALANAWRAEGRPVATIPLIPAEQTTGRRIVDVRHRTEHLAGRVAGSRDAELGSLVTAPDQVDHAPTLVHCGHNERAMSAASLLARAGHADVAALDGGPQDLAAAGARLEVGA